MTSVTALSRSDLDSVSALAGVHFGSKHGEDTRLTWLSCASGLSEQGLPQSFFQSFAEQSAQVTDLFGEHALSELVETISQLNANCGVDAVKAIVSHLHVPRAHLPDLESFVVWLSSLRKLASVAPNQVVGLCEKSEKLLSQLDAIGVHRWLMSGLTTAGSDSSRLARYLTLEDEDSREIINFEAGTLRLADIEHCLVSLTLGLWQKHIVLRAASFDQTQTSPRASFDETFVRMPRSYDGFGSNEAKRLFVAAITHIGAHIAFSGNREKPKALKPIQIAIISILEDTKAELLAARKYPGLLALWKSFHTIGKTKEPTAQQSSNCACHVVADSTPVTDRLLARFARSLVDPDYVDDNPWIQKGRNLFFEAAPKWEKDDLRRIGVLLGNDLGQMRLQFNAKTYLVEPPYRDDNLGLWDFSDHSDQAMENLDTVVASMRHERREEQNSDFVDQQSHLESKEVPSSPSRSEQNDDEGVPVCKLHEWDYLAGNLKPNWVTIIEQQPITAPAHIIDGILQKYSKTAAQISSLVKQSKIGQTKRMKRQREGERLDLDACIQQRVALRTGQNPDSGLYETTTFAHRDLSVLLLLDISESTKKLINGTSTSVFHLERDATALLAEAMNGMGDPFAVHAFCSNGRSEVRYVSIKDFGVPYNDRSKSKLAGLRPGLSTRMGAALRHAASFLDHQSTMRKLILIITDGEPSDVDVRDPKYLVEDSRKAVLELAAKGIDVFAVGLDEAAQTDLSRVFGQRNTVQIGRVESLPEKLPMLYFRLVA